MIPDTDPALDRFLPDPAATARLAKALAPILRAGDIVLLTGDLGSGKSCFARALIQGLPGPGGEDCSGEEVPSPTFTLVQIYERQVAPIWHFDLYRLNYQEEIYELGWEEALGEAILLIEWPERLGSLRPQDALTVALAIAGDGRRAQLSGGGDWPRRLARRLAAPAAAGARG
ncbi:MAG: tRNA (adenosine(37)-N6)-threonylcarbamoyltransferase complex ATPase subunit type 1 TsaE [Rhodospirillales bacterium]|nr:tRNA (adenosine(37)-N6)-threonylcarbamoyltransferase complex ATPase subunit type 1 TsaE [Rhodospirillales bacterium]